MERLEYENYEELACDISDTFDNIEDKFGDVSIIAKYEEAKEIIKELICIGYDVVSIDIHREGFEEYYNEYIISLNVDGVWCEKFKRETGYFNDKANVTYVMDNCSSVIFKHIDSEEIYEVFVDANKETDDEDIDDYEEDSEYQEEHTYMVNGKYVDRETFNNYVSKFDPDLVKKNNKEDSSNNGNYSISVKCNLGGDEVLELITDMERRIMHMNDMFREMDNFRRLFRW